MGDHLCGQIVGGSHGVACRVVPPLRATAGGRMCEDPAACGASLRSPAFGLTVLLGTAAAGQTPPASPSPAGRMFLESRPSATPSPELCGLLARCGLAVDAALLPGRHVRPASTASPTTRPAARRRATCAPAASPPRTPWGRGCTACSAAGTAPATPSTTSVAPGRGAAHLPHERPAAGRAAAHALPEEAVRGPVPRRLAHALLGTQGGRPHRRGAAGGGQRARAPPRVLRARHVQGRVLAPGRQRVPPVRFPARPGAESATA